MYVELIEKWREYHRRSMQLFSINSEGEAAVRDFARWLDRESAQQCVKPTPGMLRGPITTITDEDIEAINLI
jgi:hypothetical protein